MLFFDIIGQNVRLWGTDAESSKKAIDHGFLKEINISESSFLTYLLGAPADETSVNTGKYRGGLTQLKNEHPWLTKIHCVNHRIELAVKEAMNIPFIREIESFYNSNYALLKRSGALKAEVKTAAAAIGITYYELPRIKGMRFVSHRYCGLFRLLRMLPVLEIAYSNYHNEKKSESVKAKVQNIIKKLRSSRTICRIAAIMDIFQIMQPTSLAFEGEGLMPYDVKPTIDIAVEQLRAIAEGNGDVPLDSHLGFFKFTACDGAGVSLTRDCFKSGHEKRQTTNKECIQVDMTGITGFSDEIMKQAVRSIQQVAKDLMKILRERDLPIFKIPFYCRCSGLTQNTGLIQKTTV